jgi:hypothetical protein
VQVLVRLDDGPHGRMSLGGLGQLGLVGEVDDLDRLPARKRHALREVGVVALGIHRVHPLPPVSEMGR